jgi:hypothetical protein
MAILKLRRVVQSEKLAQGSLDEQDKKIDKAWQSGKRDGRDDHWAEISVPRVPWKPWFERSKKEHLEKCESGPSRVHVAICPSGKTHGSQEKLRNGKPGILWSEKQRTGGFHVI